jgi:heme/copper-type cytochrome/quinol oxidase subunit 2
MTRSHRPLWIGLAALAGLFLATGLPALAAHHEKGEHAGHAEHAAPAEAAGDVIQVVSTNVQGKNVYIPSTIVVEAGKPAQLSLFNTTDTPHGFSIAGAKIEEVLMPGVEHPVSVPALEAGIYTIHCQLHPPHRNGRLVVIEF